MMTAFRDRSILLVGAAAGIGRAGAIAAQILLLPSDACGHGTGQIFVSDGGYTLCP